LRGEFVRFLFVGGIGFLVDAGGTWLLVYAGLSPLVARVPAIVAAVCITWLLNRTLTFKVKAPRSSAELARYFTVAASSAAMNYLLYSILVFAGLHPVVAVAFATIALMLYSFFAYRHAVFR
jgi:putative flippase GtrA